MTSQLLPVLNEEPRYSALIGRPLDNTALKDYRACPWKYFAGMVQHRRSSGPGNPGMVHGGNWHKAMEAHYSFVPPDWGEAKYPKEAYFEMLEHRVRRVVEQKWVEHAHPDDHRTFDRLMLDYKKYLRTYGLPWEEESKTWGWPDNPLVERAIELAIPGARHPYTGKIDRIYKLQGQYYVEDHKTSSMVIKFKEYTIDSQMMGYAVLAQLVTGEPIAGVRINGVVIHKGETSFERHTISFGQDRLKDWMKNYDHWLDRLEDSARLGQAEDEEVLALAWPRNFNACVTRYGMCQYAGVCSLAPHLRQGALEEDFEVHPWNPLEADAEGGDA